MVLSNPVLIPSCNFTRRVRLSYRGKDWYPSQAPRIYRIEPL
jgi:hypothetical protein